MVFMNFTSLALRSVEELKTMLMLFVLEDKLILAGDNGFAVLEEDAAQFAVQDSAVEF